MGRIWQSNRNECLVRTSQKSPGAATDQVLQLLANCKAYQATVELDRVYAILGLAFDRFTYIIEPDCRITPRQLRLDMFEHAVTTTSLLDFIVINLKDYRTPSWCPSFVEANFLDFMIDSIYQRTAFYGYGELKTRREAAGHNPVPRYFLDREAMTLKVSGIRLRELNWVASINWKKRETGPLTATVEEVIPMLNDTLLMYASEYDVWKGSLDLLQFLWPLLSKFSIASTLGDQLSWQNWIQAQSSMVLCGQSIDRWLSMHPSSNHIKVEPQDLGLSSERQNALCASIVKIWSEGRMLAVINLEQLCWVPGSETFVFAVVALLAGCTVPVVLKWHKNTSTYRVIGPAIVPGAMDGEVWEQCQRGEAGEFEDFVLE